MPPRMMFAGKQRPPGLEFAACEGCNQGSSHADLVASLIGRFTLGNATPQDALDMKKLVSAIDNNVPGIHEELNQISAARAEAALALVPREFDPGGALNIGPTVNRYLQAFSLKLGSALHYEFSKQSLPPEGAVSA